MLKADCYDWMTLCFVWTMLKPLLLWASEPWPFSHTLLPLYILQSHCWLCCICHSSVLEQCFQVSNWHFCLPIIIATKCQLSLSASRHLCSLAKPWSQLTQLLWSHVFLRPRSLHGICTGWIGIISCCIGGGMPCQSRWLETWRSGSLPDTAIQPS